MEWLRELRDALPQGSGGGPLIGTLATVDAAGCPRARSVVVRRVDDAGRLWVTSDGRSAKNAELRANPAAELVVWLPEIRLQFRLRGPVDVLNAGSPQDERLVAWRELSDSARALFFWPEPGAARDDSSADAPSAAPASMAPPGWFEVIVLKPEEVERLDLRPHPHARRRWRQEDDWRGADVNP
jgi:pyridoxamine 5'-phosphate oxidase